MASVIGSPIPPSVIPNSACELKNLDFSWVRDLIPPTPPPVTSDNSLKARDAYTLALQEYVKLRTEEGLLENLIRPDPIAPVNVPEELLGQGSRSPSDCIQKARESVEKAQAAMVSAVDRLMDMSQSLEAGYEHSNARVDTVNKKMEATTLIPMAEPSEEMKAAQQKLDILRKEVKDVREKLNIEPEKSSVDSYEQLPLPEPPTEAEMANARKKKAHFMNMAEWYSHVLHALESIGQVKVSSEGGDLVLQFTNPLGAVAYVHLSPQTWYVEEVRVTLPAVGRLPQSICRSVDEIVAEAQLMPDAGESIRHVVRELPCSITGALNTESEVKAMKVKHLLNWKPDIGELTISLSAGIEITLQLQRDYSSIKGGIFLVNITGTGWSDEEIKVVCGKVNAMSHSTIEEVLFSVQDHITGKEEQSKDAQVSASSGGDFGDIV